MNLILIFCCCLSQEKKEKISSLIFAHCCSVKAVLHCCPSSSMCAVLCWFGIQTIFKGILGMVPMLWRELSTLSSSKKVELSLQHSCSKNLWILTNTHLKMRQYSIWTNFTTYNRQLSYSIVKNNNTKKPFVLFQTYSTYIHFKVKQIFLINSNSKFISCPNKNIVPELFVFVCHCLVN